ncbi:MAG TPA: fumarate hydratase [Eoetvoesiella sp.]
MKKINVADFIDSVATALQYISYTHPTDFVEALQRAFDEEDNPPAKGALLQLLVNSKMSMLNKRPVCQDTGVANVYVKMGTGVSLYCADGSDVPALETLVNEAIGRAYNDPRNPLRATVIEDPLGRRTNTRNNAPGVVNVQIVGGDVFDVTVAAKGGGGDVKARFKMLTASDSVADWIVSEIPKLGAGWCPPGVLGVGVGGGGPEDTMRLAKESLFTPIDIEELRLRGPQDKEEELRLELMDRINDLGIGAQGLGGKTTVLDVKVNTAPCHAAMQPVAIIPNCAATRFISFSLDGSGPARMPETDPSIWASIPDSFNSAEGIRVDLDTLSSDGVKQWKTGQLLLLSGKLLTGRDAAHKRLVDLLDRNEPLPVSLENRVIFYVGPVDPVEDEVIGPAGPTTSARMDKFLRQMMGQGLLASVGKAERTKAAVDVIKEFGAAYLIAVGGAAYLASKSVVSSRVVAFADLGMEAIYEFEVKDMPVTVAVDAEGKSIHKYIPISTSY